MTSIVPSGVVAPVAAAGDTVTQLSDSLAETSLFSVAAEQLLAAVGSPPPASASTTSLAPAPLTTQGPTPAGDDCKGSISPGEVRGFLVPRFVQFLTSDDHVNINEAVPNPLGCVTAGLATTPDSLLLSMPLPVLSVSSP